MVPCCHSKFSNFLDSFKRLQTLNHPHVIHNEKIPDSAQHVGFNISSLRAPPCGMLPFPPFFNFSNFVGPIYSASPYLYDVSCARELSTLQRYASSVAKLSSWHLDQVCNLCSHYPGELTMELALIATMLSVITATLFRDFNEGGIETSGYLSFS